MKRTYLVIACTKCQQYLLARQGAKTRQCPYCGARLNLSRAEVFCTTSDLEEARSILHSKRQTKSGPSIVNEDEEHSSTHF